MLLHKRQQTLRMSIHSELRDLKSEGIHFRNKYKFIVLKISLMPQIKETFVWSNVNTKSTSQYPLDFCSDVSFIGTVFIGTVFSRNLHLLFVLSLLISVLRFVFLLLSLHWTTNFKNSFVSVTHMLLIYLFASMKLEKGQKINWL